MSDETFLCQRRPPEPHPFKLPDHDTWDVSPNGDRTCSYCGSVHPDDFFACLEEAAKEGTDVRIEPSDKGYKFYVTRPDVMNAMEGGIKFYTWHIPSKEWADKANALFPEALRRSKERFDAFLASKGYKR